MKYIIADPDERNGLDLKKILDGYEMLDFVGNFTTLEVAENCIREEMPDIAFIRMGTAELNAFKLVGTLRGLNPSSKVIFLSSQVAYAVEAFECEAEGFLMLPFERGKIKHLLFRIIKKIRA